MYARLWKYTDIFTFKKLVSTFPESRNTCEQQLVTWGPAHVAFPIHDWAQDMALPPHCWGKVEPGHRWLRVAVPGEPGRWPPGRLSMPRRSHSTVWCFPHMWNSAALLDAGTLQCPGTFPCGMCHRMGTVHRCFPSCQRGWDLTLGQETAQDRSVKTHRSHGIAGARELHIKPSYTFKHLASGGTEQ